MFESYGLRSKTTFYSGLWIKKKEKKLYTGKSKDGGIPPVGRNCYAKSMRTV